MTIDRVDTTIAFGAASTSISDDGSLRLALPIDRSRDLRLAARLHRPAVVRDGLLALGDVLASDLRRKATDRADYLQYLIQRGKGVGKAVWDAQREYLALQYGAVAKQDEPLDPVVTLSRDAVRFEAMSRDESTYAQLVLRRPAALVDRDHAGDQGTATGTTFVDLAGALAAIGRVRSYRATTLELAATDAPVERVKATPVKWLRAFGQMQAATLLGGDRFALAPIDLYNVLLTLRMKKAKTAPRGLRYELVPGERPRLVLEPWELVVHATGEPYRGKQPRVIRTWGRNRLNLLARVLPHAKSLHVTVAGQGLPATYVVDLGDASFAVALSGWTDASWSGIATFDLLAATTEAPVDAMIKAALATPRDPEAALRGLAELHLGHDLATGELFVRPLTRQPIARELLRFRDAREAAAHRLLEQNGVTLTKVADLGVDGRAIEGQVVDQAAHRTFHPGFAIDREGRTGSAVCTCGTFRRSGVKEGPCEHMLALRVAYARELARLEAARATPEGRAQITAETRVLLRRTAAGAETFRLSLDGRQVIARFGIKEPLRLHRLRFDSLNDARAAYFARLDELTRKGYVDASE